MRSSCEASFRHDLGEHPGGLQDLHRHEDRVVAVLLVRRGFADASDYILQAIDPDRPRANPLSFGAFADLLLVSAAARELPHVEPHLDLAGSIAVELRSAFEDLPAHLRTVEQRVAPG